MLQNIGEWRKNQIARADLIDLLLQAKMDLGGLMMKLIRKPLLLLAGFDTSEI